MSSEGSFPRDSSYAAAVVDGLGEMFFLVDLVGFLIEPLSRIAYCLLMEIHVFSGIKQGADEVMLHQKRHE